MFSTARTGAVTMAQPYAAQQVLPDRWYAIAWRRKDKHGKCGNA